MQQEPKLKIKEAENVIDTPVNKDKILERLSAMTEDIMFVRKEIENGRKNEDHKEDIAKGLEEEIMKKDDYLIRQSLEEMEKKDGSRIKERRKMENDPRSKLK